MNYFTWLLVSAGLPVLGLSSPAPAPAPTPSSAPAHTIASAVSLVPASAPVATEAQAMATIQTYLASRPAAPPSPAPTAPSAPPGTSSPTLTTAPASSANGPATAQDPAATLIAWINQARAAQGLTPYSVNPTLMTLAQERAQALATGPFTHDLPGLGWPIQMETAAGIQAQAMGAENIAVAPNLQTAFSLLMASPEHRANILSPYETQIGVGVAPDGNGVAISELFIGPNL
ncbi:MAG: CAP domain-containing protein [Firmicutes bacterium]|nr:CAP domain-containing protein [Bacillota bacterium]